MDEMKKYRCKDGDVEQATPGTCPTHNTPLEEVCDCGSNKMASECCKMSAETPAEPVAPAETPVEATPAPEAFPQQFQLRKLQLSPLQPNRNKANSRRQCRRGKSPDADKVGSRILDRFAIGTYSL